MNLKVRLSVMNFLEFAVWGAYLTSMGNYRQSGNGSRNIMVLCYTRYRIHLHAYPHGYCGRQMDTATATIGTLSPRSRSRNDCALPYRSKPGYA